MSADLERLAAEFQKFQTKIKQAEQRFSGVGDMREQLSRLEAVATSPDRAVRVVAGAGGAVLDLQLTPDAMRYPSTELASTIMTTLRAAVAEAVRRQAGIVDGTVGDALGVSTTDQVRQAQDQAFGVERAPEPPERFAPAETSGTEAYEPPSQHSGPQPPRRRPVRGDDEDDFSQDSIY